MNGIFLRWGIPALFTVVGGTAAAVLTGGAAIAPDLAARTTAALSASGDDWAEVTFDMRDATLTGTATTQEMIDTVTARVAAIHGVRSVTSAIALAEFVSPFPFTASLEQGRVTLSGGLPDAAARAELLALAGPEIIDETRPMSGAPDRRNWSTGIRLALDYLSGFDEGKVTLADLDLEISGRARDGAAYDRLLRLAEQPVPEPLSVRVAAITPPLASPFEWHAEFDGTRLRLSGHTPDPDLLDAIRSALPPSVTISSSLVLASGAPESFQENTVLLVSNLVKLERGAANISGDTLGLEGDPRDAVTAETVRLAVTALGAEATLAPPRVESYWFSATRRGDTLVLEGYVPDTALRDRLAAAPGRDATALELARGAPERFESAVDYVLDAMSHLSEGRATVSGTELAIAGRGRTVGEFGTLEQSLRLGPPQGLTLASAEIKPPLASPFVFKAEKSSTGQVTLTGYVPTEPVRDRLVGLLPEGTRQSLVLADGNPPDFEASAAQALALLPLLDFGSIAFDGKTWSISGSVDTPKRAFEVDAAVRSAALRDAGWIVDIRLPPAPALAPLPVVDPYVWRAQKRADGAVTFSGFVPTEQLKRYLAGRAGGLVTDGTTLAAGAPQDFIPSALAGLDALLGMDEGALALAAGQWSLTGSAPSTAGRIALEKSLVAAVDSSKWTIGIQAAGAAPVVSPFVWAAIKAADGSYTLSGYVPTEELRTFVSVRVGRIARDTTLVGSGEPEGFTADVLAALEALQHLESGEARFVDGRWLLNGQPLQPEDVDAVDTALLGASDKGAGWQRELFALPAPEPELALEEPIAAEPLPESVAKLETPEEAESLVELPLPPALDMTDASPLMPAGGVSDDPVAEAEPAEEAEPIASAPAPADEPATESPSLSPTTPTAVPEPTIEVAAIPEAVEPLPDEPVVRDYVFDARKALAGPIGFSGAVPAEALRRHLAVIARTEPNEGLEIRADLPSEFVLNADAGTRALTLLADGEFGLEGDLWVFRGRAESEAQREAALEALAAVPTIGDWDARITLLPPIEICRSHVTAFQSRNAILFQSGSARIADESLPALDELAAYLSECPETTVDIEGHTDSDGDDSANLALSVARAEAVVDALILRNVGPERLYAVGYGESLPIASNDTNAGKQANRRIAFTLTDERAQ